MFPDLKRPTASGDPLGVMSGNALIAPNVSGSLPEADVSSRIIASPTPREIGGAARPGSGLRTKNKNLAEPHNAPGKARYLKRKPPKGSGRLFR